MQFLQNTRTLFFHLDHICWLDCRHYGYAINRGLVGMGSAEPIILREGVWTHQFLGDWRENHILTLNDTQTRQSSFSKKGFEPINWNSRRCPWLSSVVRLSSYCFLLRSYKISSPGCIWCGYVKLCRLCLLWRWWKPLLFTVQGYIYWVSHYELGTIHKLRRQLKEEGRLPENLHRRDSMNLCWNNKK